jgi:NTP pyrophosphatase (non-canonical NTP hydrolase)
MDTDIYPIMPKFYNNCIMITEQYEKLWGRWSDDSQLLHIITEVAELKDVLRNKDKKYGDLETEIGYTQHTDKLLDELADVFLTTFALAGKLGIGISMLNGALDKKLEIVAKRVLTLQLQNKEGLQSTASERKK